MTDTPLTDALARTLPSKEGCHYAWETFLPMEGLARALERQLAAATARLEAAEKRLRYQYSCYVKNCENAGLITNAISYDVWLNAIDAAQGSKP